MLVHVAIVSEQLLPTVIPCLMAQPDRVVLVASRAMAGQARRLRAVLQEHGIKSEIHGVPVPDFRINAIRAYATKLAEKLETDHTEAELVFNATGGTKLMTLGFVDVFQDRADRIIYTDTAHAQIEVIHDRRTAKPQPEPMRSVLDVPRYLAVQGFRYQGDCSKDQDLRARMTARGDAARYLADHALPLAGLIGMLNHLVNTQALDADGRSLKQPAQSLGNQPRAPWPAALKTLHQAGVLQWSGGPEIRFPDIESARFLSGGWLEEYAFTVAEEANLHDVRLNVHGVWDGAEAARNEFDVLACHRNRLLFVECKTLKFEEGRHDNELSYKVESLGKDTRGLFGDIWLVTARVPTKVLRDRARQAGFRLIGPTDLPYLRKLVREWKQGASTT